MSVAGLYAQDENPFARYGYHVPVATMTNGRFPEFHDRQDVVQIGSVLFNARADTISGDIATDTTVMWLEAQTVSRFITIDPHAERYYNISPYAYCANNPIKYIDPDGMDFYVSFHGDGAEKLFRKIFDDAFNNQFEVYLTQQKDNYYRVDIVATEGGGDFSKISEGAYEFYNGMKEVINANRVVNVAVYNGSSDISIGNFRTNSIDVADMNQFENLDNSKTVQNSATRQGKMVHETQEQYQKNLKGIPRGSGGRYQDVESSHRSALPYENRVNGNERQLKDGNAGRNRGVYEYYKKPDGTIVRIRVEGGQNSSPRPIIKLTY